MWFITSVGFFSIVEKPDDRKRATLTVRARLRSDLAALKEAFLPSLGTISESVDTDYRYRATAPRADVSRAAADMITALDYGNFKSVVAARQGAQRAHVYHDVWEVLYAMQCDPQFERRPRQQTIRKPKVPKADAYGGVLMDDEGKAQLREPANHFGQYVWTFAKGRAEKGETPVQTALREVLEETGQSANIVALIPQVFAGATSSTVFFLMEPRGEPGPFSEETASVRWVDEKAARRLIGKTTTPAGRTRDLLVLEAAFAAWRAHR